MWKILGYARSLWIHIIAIWIEDSNLSTWRNHISLHRFLWKSESICHVSEMGEEVQNRTVIISGTYCARYLPAGLRITQNKWHQVSKPTIGIVWSEESKILIFWFVMIWLLCGKLWNTNKNWAQRWMSLTLNFTEINFQNHYLLGFYSSS
jgi:hypothetical protein